MDKGSLKIITTAACVVWVSGIISGIISSRHDYLNDFLWINIGGFGVMYLLGLVRMNYLEDKEFAETEPDRRKLQKKS